MSTGHPVYPDNIPVWFYMWIGCYLCLQNTQSHPEPLSQKTILAERLHWCNPGLLWWESGIDPWDHSSIHQPHLKLQENLCLYKICIFCSVWHHTKKVRFLLQSVWNGNRFDRKHLHAWENSLCEWHLQHCIICVALLRAELALLVITASLVKLTRLLQGVSRHWTPGKFGQVPGLL